MTPENRTSRPFAALTVTAILLVATAAGMGALARIFQAPLVIATAQNDFHLVDTDQTRSKETPTASYQDSFSQAAPAWLVNAMPGYSSGRARELWYLSLNRAADQELRLVQSTGGYVTATSPYRAVQTNVGFAAFASGGAPISSTS